MRVDRCLLVLVLCLGGPALGARLAHAEEPPPAPPDVPGTYAGKDAAWWIGQLRDPAMHKGALQALQRVGKEGAAALIAALDDDSPEVRLGVALMLRKWDGAVTVPSDVLARRLAAERDEATVHALLLLAGRAAPTLPLVEALLQQCASSDPRLRQAACTILGGLQLVPEQVPPGLLRLLETGDLVQASAALRALSSAPGAPDAGLRAGLAVLAREQEPDARLVQEARQLVLRAGPRASELRAALTSAAARWPGPAGAEALSGLAEIAPQDPATGALVVGALRAPSEARRHAARTILEQQPMCVQTCPGTLVLEILTGPDASASADLVRALARVGSREAGILPSLAQRLHAAPDDAPVRSALVAMLATAPLSEVLEVAAGLPVRLRGGALEALQRRRVTPGEPVTAAEGARLLGLLELWSQGSEALSAQQVAIFLQQRFLGVQDDDALQVLERLLLHPDAQVASAASQCLNMSPQGIARRLALLRSPRVEVRRSALRGARAGRGSTASDAEHAALLAALDDPDAEVRASVARWLGTWSGWAYDPTTWPAPPERRRALAQATLDLARLGTPGDRGLAVQLYVQAAVPRAEMLPVLRGLLGDPADLVQPSTLSSAFALTAEWVEAPVVAELLQDLEAPEMVRRADAALVLASLRQESQRTLEALPGLLAHPSPRIVRRGVALALYLGPVAASAAPTLVRRIDADQPAGIGHDGVMALVAVAPEASETLAALRRWLREPQRPLRHSLPTAIAKLGRTGVPLLVEGLDLGSPVAELCLRSLQQLGRDAADALPALRERARRRPSDQALAAAIAAIEGA